MQYNYNLYEMYNACHNNAGVNRYDHVVFETENGDQIECWTRQENDDKTYIFKVVLDMYIKEQFMEPDIQLGLQKAAYILAKMRNDFNVKFAYKYGDMGHFA